MTAWGEAGVWVQHVCWDSRPVSTYFLIVPLPLHQFGIKETEPGREDVETPEWLRATSRGSCDPFPVLRMKPRWGRASRKVSQGPVSSSTLWSPFKN